MAEHDRGDYRSGVSRKRPLEVIPLEGHHVLSSQEENCAANTVIDEIELHFQRSLFKDKNKWKSHEKNSPEEFVKNMNVVSSPNLLSQMHHCGKKHDGVSEKHTNISKYSHNSSFLLPCTCTSNQDPKVNKEVAGEVRVSLSSRKLSGESSSNITLSSISVPVPLGDYNNQLISDQLHKDTEKIDVLSSKASNSTENVSQCGFVPNVTQSAVQVIDLTKQISKSGSFVQPTLQNSYLSLKKSQLSKEVILNPASRSEAMIDGAHTIFTRNFTSTIPQGTTVNSPLILLPATQNNIETTVLMQPQPYILVDSSKIQAHIAGNCNGDGTMVVPSMLSNPGGGSNYFFLSSNPTVSNSFIQFSTGVNSDTDIATSTVFKTSRKDRSIIAPTKEAEAPTKPSNDEINVMPASVEDHFAKALGDQWSKLNSSANVNISLSPHTVAS